MTASRRSSRPVSGPEGGAVSPPVPALGGGCQGGAVHVRVVARPPALYGCHCRECQRRSSSAFGMSMRPERGALVIDRARMAARTRDEGAPTEVAGWSCGRCGVRLVHARPDALTVTLKAGALDDTSRLRPVGHLWTSRAQPWVRLAGDALLYDARSLDHDAPAAAWRAHQPALERRA